MANALRNLAKSAALWVVVSALVGAGGGYAVLSYEAPSDDCCAPGAPCCYPGSPCCALRARAH